MKNKDAIRRKVNIEENIVIFFIFLPRKEKATPKIAKKSITKNDNHLFDFNILKNCLLKLHIIRNKQNANTSQA